MRPSENDHLALAADLRALFEAGKKVIPLDALLDWLDGDNADEAVANSVVLTFDDGCDFDVLDIEYPGHGLQRSFLGIMEDFLGALGEGERPQLHATSFVIASRDARRQIDSGSLFGRGWISDDWWRDADAHPLLSVENHGWDHNHPDLDGHSRGNFHTVDTYDQCNEQVVTAAKSIEDLTGRRPRYFAYPFGESSHYIRETFFPGHVELHACRAALGTEAGRVTRNTDRWNLPRYVCGRDWSRADALISLVG
jgi:peptidoglycan/xylan/chitin deacetylase (PgdA/CDA1 family)